MSLEDSNRKLEIPAICSRIEIHNLDPAVVRDQTGVDNLSFIFDAEVKIISDDDLQISHLSITKDPQIVLTEQVEDILQKLAQEPGVEILFY